jgi:hypothetical protein
LRKLNVVALVAVGLIVAAGAGYFFVARQKPAPAPIHAVTPSPAPAPAIPAFVAPPADCLLPGPAPVVPNGLTASSADMKLAHDVIQGFVHQLERYQACRNTQIDHAAASVSAQQKQSWVDQGNAAVDQAEALANAFSAQLKIYNARTHPH